MILLESKAAMVDLSRVKNPASALLFNGAGDNPLLPPPKISKPPYLYRLFCGFSLKIEGKSCPFGLNGEDLRKVKGG